MLLRCTTRLRELLSEPMIEERPGSLEDWYANVLWVQRRKCLLLTHAGTLFTVFAPNARRRAARPDRVTIAKTVDRQVLGCMNEPHSSARARARTPAASPGSICPRCTIGSSAISAQPATMFRPSTSWPADSSNGAGRRPPTP